MKSTLSVSLQIVEGAAEEGELVGVEFEVVADNDQVGSCRESSRHLLGGTDTTSDDKRDTDLRTHRTDNRLTDRRISTAARLEINQAFAQQLGGDSRIGNLREVGLRNRLSMRNSLYGSRSAAINKDITHRNTLDTRCAYRSGCAYLLPDQCLGVAPRKQGQEEKRIGNGSELQSRPWEKNDRERGERTQRANKRIDTTARTTPHKDIIGQVGATERKAREVGFLGVEEEG